MQISCQTFSARGLLGGTANSMPNFSARGLLVVFDVSRCSIRTYGEAGDPILTQVLCRQGFTSSDQSKCCAKFGHSKYHAKCRLSKYHAILKRKTRAHPHDDTAHPGTFHNQPGNPLASGKQSPSTCSILSSFGIRCTKHPHSCSRTIISLVVICSAPRVLSYACHEIRILHAESLKANQTSIYHVGGIHHPKILSGRDLVNVEHTRITFVQETKIAGCPDIGQCFLTSAFSIHSRMSARVPKSQRFPSQSLTSQ